MESLDIGKLQEMEFSELKNFALKLGIEYTGSRKEELINEIIEAKSDGDTQFYGGGVLEILDDRDQHYGFLRSPRSNYLQSNEDIQGIDEAGAVLTAEMSLVWLFHNACE